jgi:TatA/E family protein of Tat protein translocase
MSMYSNVIQQLAGVGGIEWIIIIIIFLALIFGSKKLPEFARGIGKATSEFEKAKVQMRREVEMAKTQYIDTVPNPNPNPNPDRWLHRSNRFCAVSLRCGNNSISRRR